MDLTALKEKIYDNLLKAHFRMKEFEAKTVTGLLTASAIWPIIAAAQSGDMQTIKAFWQLSGSLGINLLSSRIDAWEQSVTSEAQAVAAIEEEMDDNAELRAELEAFVKKLDVITEALKRQSEEDRTWLEETLREEWIKKGKGDEIETLIQISVKENKGNVIGKQENVTNNIETQIINKGTSKEERAAKEKHAARLNYLDGLKQFCLRLPLASLGLVTHPDKKVTLQQVYIDLNTTTLRESLSKTLQRSIRRTSGCCRKR